MKIKRGLVFGLLFDMCQLELELKGKTEDDLRVNKSGIEKAIKNADKAVDVYGKYIWRK